MYTIQGLTNWGKRHTNQIAGKFAMVIITHANLLGSAH